MVGRASGAFVKLRKQHPTVQCSHFSTAMQLQFKQMLLSLKSVFYETVKINFIKATLEYNI